MSIELDGEPFSVVEYERSKMQQRAPVMRIRFRSLRTGKTVDRTFSGYDVSFTPAAVDRRRAQYIYEDTGFYYFMDSETYEQFPMSTDQMDTALNFIVEQTEVDLVFFEDFTLGGMTTVISPLTFDLSELRTSEIGPLTNSS